jgi:hypothetical protein
MTIQPHTLSGGTCPLLGCGNSGVVYRATEVGHPRREAVALKVVLKPDFASSLVLQHKLNLSALYVDLEF